MVFKIFNVIPGCRKGVGTKNSYWKNSKVIASSGGDHIILELKEMKKSHTFHLVEMAKLDCIKNVEGVKSYQV